MLQSLYSLNSYRQNDIFVFFTIYYNCIIFVNNYEYTTHQRGVQRISKLTITVLAAMWTSSFVYLLVAICKATTWLSYLYFFSYLKILITLIKYIPQVLYAFSPHPTLAPSLILPLSKLMTPSLGLHELQAKEYLGLEHRKCNS